MKNNECTIYIMKGDKCVNKFRKDKAGWSLTIATGRVFPCTCEQMVSHLLPSLAFGSKKGLTVKVVPDQEGKVIAERIRHKSCLTYQWLRHKNGYG